MKEPAKPPYEGYMVYRVFSKKDGRYLAVLFSRGHRTTIAYAKYVLETSLGRRLKPGHEVHHRDENKTNDAVDNLEEMEMDRHHRKHARGRTMIEGLCEHCGVRFYRDMRNAKLMKFCTRDCFIDSLRRVPRKPVQSEGSTGVRRCLISTGEP